MTTKVRTAIVAVIGLLLTACQPSRFTYVHNSQEGAYVKFPSEWHLFDAEDFLEHQFGDLAPGARESVRQQFWAIAFDADPEPTLAHLNGPNQFPFGLVQVIQLGEEERDAFSLASLRNQVMDFDEALAAGAIDPLLVKDVTTPEGLRGMRLRFNVLRLDGEFTFDQTAFVDADTRTVYVLFVGCAVDCFKAHSAEIDQITESWTVKEPQI